MLEETHHYDDFQDQLDLLNYELKKQKKENMELFEHNQKTISGIIKGCKLLEKAVNLNANHVERLIKNQKKLLRMIEK